MYIQTGPHGITRKREQNAENCQKAVYGHVSTSDRNRQQFKALQPLCKARRGIASFDLMFILNLSWRLILNKTPLYYI